MKKGVSPIIAAVLLIAVTVGIAAIVINWASTFTKQETGKIEGNAHTECSGLTLRFDETPAFDSSSHKITLKMTNIGTNEFDAVKELVIWNDDNITHFNKTFNITKGDYKIITLTDSDVSSGNNLTAMSGKEMIELRIYAKGCESSPMTWKKTPY